MRFLEACKCHKPRTTIHVTCSLIMCEFFCYILASTSLFVFSFLVIYLIYSALRLFVAQFQVGGNGEKRIPSNFFSFRRFFFHFFFLLSPSKVQTHTLCIIGSIPARQEYDDVDDARIRLKFRESLATPGQTIPCQQGPEHNAHKHPYAYTTYKYSALAVHYHTRMSTLRMSCAPAPTPPHLLGYALSAPTREQHFLSTASCNLIQ